MKTILCIGSGEESVSLSHLIAKLGAIEKVHGEGALAYIEETPVPGCFDICIISDDEQGM